MLPMGSRNALFPSAACMLLLVCSAGVCQSSTGDRESPEQAAGHFIRQILMQCPASDSPSLSKPSVWYSSRIEVPGLSCADTVPHVPRKCEAVYEYDDAVFAPKGGNLTPADAKNKISWRGAITAQYSTFRVRHIADGVWGEWSKYLDKEEPERPYKIANLWNDQGAWKAEGGDDWLKFRPGYASFDHIVMSSCSDIEKETPVSPVQSVSRPRVGNAVTTRVLPDPNPNAPRGCEVPEGTKVMIQADDPRTDKTRIFVLPVSNGPRDSRRCTNFLTVNRKDVRALGPGH